MGIQVELRRREAKTFDTSTSLTSNSSERARHGFPKVSEDELEPLNLKLLRGVESSND